MRLPSTAQLIAMKTINIIGTPRINISRDSATLSPIVLGGAFGDGGKVFGRIWFLDAAANVLGAGASETGTSRLDCWLTGDSISGVAVAATALPQLPQKAVPASNLVPHFVQKGIRMLLTCPWQRLVYLLFPVPG